MISDSRKFCSWFFESLTVRSRRSWASCRSVWLIRQFGSGAPSAQLSAAIEDSRLVSSYDKSEHDPSISNCVTSCAKCDEFKPFVEWHLDSFVWGSVSACGARRSLQDHDSQHGDGLAGARIETASAVQHSAIKPIADGKLVGQVQDEDKNAAQSFKTQESCNSLWKVELKEASFSEAVQRLVDRVASGIDGFPTQSHGNLLWLVARPPCSHDSFVRAVVVAVQARLSEFGVTCLSASLWSLANLSLP